MPSIEI